MRAPLTLDVAVPDVPVAVNFYTRALAPESVLDMPSGAVELWLVPGGGLVLRIVDERTHAPSRRDRDLYVKGTTPRLELVVEDVEDRVAKMTDAGATLRERRGRDALVIDPFGHAWVIAAPADEGPDPGAWC